METRERWIAALLASGVALVLAGVATADEPSAKRRVSFRVESDREVANDWLRASLAVTDEDADPAALANRVNQLMDWALGAARGEKRVRVQSGGYNTHPVYESNRIRRWRASQQVWIESADFDAATRLVGELQSRLQLQSIDFSVSPEQRRKVEDGLIEEALAAFKARAELVRTNLGASGYEIVQLGIDTPGGAPPPRPMMHMAARAEADVAPPALEGGTTRVAVHIDATIELD
jgi:predicted secreted protein